MDFSNIGYLIGGCIGGIGGSILVMFALFVGVSSQFSEGGGEAH